MTNWTIDTKERLYQKLADEIFFRVLHGKFPLGSKLPSRTVLIREANTSQDTLRKALAQLASQKVLFKTRQGIYVTSDEQVLKKVRQQYIERTISKCQSALKKVDCEADIQIANGCENNSMEKE